MHTRAIDLDRLGVEVDDEIAAPDRLRNPNSSRPIARSLVMCPVIRRTV
jgi:hypothetical protein